MNKKGGIKLNLGCGKNKKDGFINCDLDPAVKPDMIVDMNKKLGFKTSSVDEIFTSHTLEHLERDVLIKKTLPEIWRICKKGAKVTIIVPYMDAQNVLNHKTRFNEDTFRNWCKEIYESSDAFPFDFSFELISYKLSMPFFYKWLFLIPFKSWRGLWSHLISEIKVELVAKK